MKSLKNTWSLLVVLGVVLTGCESGKDVCDKSKVGGVTNVQDDTLVMDDEVLRNAAIDFIANAGDRVYFPYDSSSITPESAEILNRQADWLKQHPERRLLIEGHCDDRGTREYNLGLGERRADAAARYLIDRGVSGDNVRTVSYGKDRPIAVQGSLQEQYRLNRVNIMVIE